MSQSPKVSVLMPAYNAERYINDSVISVLNQSYSDFEFLILDDCSNDKTFEIVNSYADPRIRILQNKVNSGIVNSRNRLISESRGMYLAWLDADDICSSDRLKLQTSFLDENPEFSMVGSSVALIDGNNNNIGNWNLETNPEFLKMSLIFMNQFAQSSIMLRRSMLGDVRYDVKAEPVEDYLMWFQLTQIGRSVNLPDYLVSYRVHPKSVTVNRLDLNIAGVAFVQRRILNDLGISFTEKEFRIHHNISFPGHFRDDGTSFRELISWFKKLKYCLNNKFNLTKYDVQMLYAKEIRRLMPFFDGITMLYSLFDIWLLIGFNMIKKRFMFLYFKRVIQLF